MSSEFPIRRLASSICLAVLASCLAVTAQAQILAPNMIYTSIQPCRIFDTRSSGAGQLVAGVTQTFNVVGNTTGTYFTGQGGTNGGCSLPGFDTLPQARVQAVVLNLVAITPSGAGNLVAWPTDQAAPGSSVINYSSGITVANAIVIPVRQDSAGGDISIKAQVSNAHALGDVMGFFSFESPTPATTDPIENLFIGKNAGNIANVTGSANEGFGHRALFSLTSGGGNEAFGWEALFGVSSGSHNTAMGEVALIGLTTGQKNVAVGGHALQNVATGSSNSALGFAAGSSLTSGDSNNIEIATFGVAGDSGVIRIGDTPQTSTFIAGINGVTSSGGTAVFVNSNGKLGTATSSLRFKEDVRDMAGASAGLMQLRPITFHYKPQFDDGSRLLQYGLAAEEVAKVNPELVQYDGDGHPLAVRYHFINAMVLNEVQRQHTTIDRQQARLAEQQAQLEEQKAQIAELQRQVRTLLAR
jgi:hypothetical protein